MGIFPSKPIAIPPWLCDCTVRLLYAHVLSSPLNIALFVTTDNPLLAFSCPTLPHIHYHVCISEAICW